jgi:V/A-type H+-transporting ATPase subunit D
MVMAMTRVRALPPGRAGRTWLRRRLVAARRGADLLDRKLRILRLEQQRYQLLAERTEAAWLDAQADAETWMLRAALLGGERAVRLATDGGHAEVTITWATTMGVSHPTQGTCCIPERPPTMPSPTSTALAYAAAAYATALRAAVDHAAADAALHAVEHEVDATRRRVRAINDRWIPRLTEAQHRVQLVLDEQEHDDAVRLRWAVKRGARFYTTRNQRRSP